MSNQNRLGSNLLEGQVKHRGTKRYKARLPILQRLSFSIGNFLNDVVASAWCSYLLIFLTKVVGMSNRTAGFLFIVCYSVDAVLCILVGYICDNHKFPFLAKYYGKRKCFNLLGTVLTAGLFPFLMMPCFACGDNPSQWKLGLYYSVIMIVHNIGWSLSQVTHLALIPEIAKRPNEMVELHALRSVVTFISGIFMYAITWILLKTDGGDERISASQWKDFMKMSVIVVGTGCFFSLVFHLVTKEPLSTVQNGKGSDGFIGRERQRSRTATLPLPDKAIGVFCFYDESDLVDAMAADDSPMEVIKEEQSTDTVLENKEADSLKNADVESSATDLEENKKHNEFSFSNPGFQTVDDSTMDDLKTAVVVSNEDSGTESSEKPIGQSSKENKFNFLDVESTATELQKNKKNNEFIFSNPGFQTEDEPTMDDKKTVVVLNEDSGNESSEKPMTQPSKENQFNFSNPAFISQDKQGLEGDISQERSRLDVDSQHENLVEERLSHRSDSSGFSEGYASSPETDSVYSIDGSFIENKPRTEQADYMKEEAYSQTRPRSLSSRRNRGSSFTKGTDTTYGGVSVIIEEVNEHEMKSRKTRKTWSDWFKIPMFYKISFAFMCTRIVQILTASYAPMYLIETLGFEKESIAYFPLVILISGVFSSLGAKKLDKMLGAKWTYCLASSLVIGSSAWFYLLGMSGRNAAYCAAILVGCGSSVMYVTSLALAGQLIGDNKESGAFVFASMSVLSKVVCGVLIFCIQEFFPSHGSTAEYVRYVFSVVPGAGSILGFLAVIAFLPATVRCRKIVHTVDSSVQTDDTSDVLYAYDNPGALYDEDKGNETVVDVTNGKSRLVS